MIEKYFTLACGMRAPTLAHMDCSKSHEMLCGSAGNNVGVLGELLKEFVD
jgi:hypothetical protein